MIPDAVSLVNQLAERVRADIAAERGDTDASQLRRELFEDKHFELVALASRIEALAA